MNNQSGEDINIPPASRSLRSSSAQTATDEDFTKYVKGNVIPAFGVSVEEILHRSSDHLIFLDPELVLRWLYKTRPADSIGIESRLVELQAKCEFFKEVPLHAGRERSAKRYIGQGLLILCTGGSRAEADQALTNAENFILQCGRQVSLGWLYETFGWLAVTSLAVPTLFFFLSKPGQCHGGQLLLWGEFPWSILLCAAAGGIGAYISRALNSRTDLPCDANSGKALHQHEAVLRWSVGLVAGGLIGLLIKSKVLLGNLTGGGDQDFAVTLALALLAGLSERFLPSLRNRFDQRFNDPQEGEPTPADPASPAAGETPQQKARKARTEATEARLAADAAQEKAIQARKIADAADKTTKDTKEAEAKEAETKAKQALEHAEELETAAAALEAQLES